MVFPLLLCRCYRVQSHRKESRCPQDDPDNVRDVGIRIFLGSENVKVTHKGNTYDYEYIEDFYNAVDA